MVITNRITIRSRAPSRYVTQSGMVVSWVGGGGMGGGSGCGAINGGTRGAVCGGVGTGTIIVGDTGGGVGGVGDDSVLKVLDALQAL